MNNGNKRIKTFRILRHLVRATQLMQRAIINYLISSTKKISSYLILSSESPSKEIKHKARQIIVTKFKEIVLGFNKDASILNESLKDQEEKKKLILKMEFSV